MPVEVDKKKLILVGVSVFALFVMGALLSFKTQIKEIATPDTVPNQISSVNPK